MVALEYLWSSLEISMVFFGHEGSTTSRSRRARAIISGSGCPKKSWPNSPGRGEVFSGTIASESPPRVGHNGSGRLYALSCLILIVARLARKRLSGFHHLVNDIADIEPIVRVGVDHRDGDIEERSKLG